MPTWYRRFSRLWGSEVEGIGIERTERGRRRVRRWRMGRCIVYDAVEIENLEGQSEKD